MAWLSAGTSKGAVGGTGSGPACAARGQKMRQVGTGQSFWMPLPPLPLAASAAVQGCVPRQPKSLPLQPTRTSVAAATAAAAIAPLCIHRAAGVVLLSVVLQDHHNYGKPYRRSHLHNREM